MAVVRPEGERVRRSAQSVNRPLLRLAAATLSLCMVFGCSGLPKKKSGSTSTPPPNSSSEPFWNDSTPAQPRTNGSTANVPGPGDAVQPAAARDGDGSGIFAGRVFDTGRSQPGVVFVQVQATDGSSPPVEVETDAQGRFVIRGVSPVRTYRLSARTKRDGRLVSGEVVARPPDTRLLIAIGDELTGGSTPPLPDSTNPRASTGTTPGAELGTPRSGGDYYPPPTPDMIAGNDFAATPRANIPAPGLPNTASGANPEWARVSGPVPDCLVASGRVLTLRLRDPDGGVWDFSQREGRLVLIDLWGSWCGPCLRAIPDLVRLQSQYRSKGLEVIGIACERGNGEENTRRVRKARQMLGNVNYRLLMAGEPESDPIRSQFRPAGFPALYLLDSDGTILWRGVGTDTLPELEGVIRSRLDAR